MVVEAAVPDPERRQELSARLSAALLTGEVVRFAREVSEPDDPRQGLLWGKNRLLPAGVISDALLASDATNERGLWIEGAFISGPLDVRALRQMPYPLSLDSCYLDHPLDVSGMSLRSLDLRRTVLPALIADHVAVHGDILITNGSVLSEGASLKGARVDGSVSFSDSEFGSSSTYSVLADQLQVKGDLYCERSVFLATARFIGAQVTGYFSLRSARFSPGADLRADGISIGRDCLLTEQFTTGGMVLLDRSRVGGTLECSGNFDSSSEVSLSCSLAHIEGNLNAASGFSAMKQVQLSQAKVRGSLSLDGARLGVVDAPVVDAPLLADRIEVGGDVSLNMESRSTISIVGGVIAGRVDCSRAKLRSPDQIALDLSYCRIGTDLILTPSFRSDGGINVTGAGIGGDVWLQGAEITRPKGGCSYCGSAQCARKPARIRQIAYCWDNLPAGSCRIWHPRLLR